MHPVTIVLIHPTSATRRELSKMMPRCPGYTLAPAPTDPVRWTTGWIRRWLIAVVVVGCLSLAPGTRATTVNPPEFPQLVNESDYIVRAVVKSVTSELRLMPSGKRMPFTLVELEVKRVIAGKPPVPLVLAVLGGSMGGRELSISGAPKFAVGEESILFVQGNGRQIYPLVRMAHGHYPIMKEAATGREFMARSDGAPLRSVNEVSRPIHATGGKVAQSSPATAQAASQALTPDEFIQKIRTSITEPRLLEK